MTVLLENTQMIGGREHYKTLMCHVTALCTETLLYLVDETGLANVGVTAQKQSPRVGINGRQTGQMLTH